MRKDFIHIMYLTNTGSNIRLCRPMVVEQSRSTLSSSQTTPASPSSTEIIKPQKDSIHQDNIAQRNISSESNHRHLQHKYWEDLFDLDIPEGKCVGLRISPDNYTSDSPLSLDLHHIKSNKFHWIRGMLHPDEVKFGIDLPSEPARLSFFMGRLAMRKALKLMKQKTNKDDPNLIMYTEKSNFTTSHPVVTSLDPPILKDEYGRPQVPLGFIGSISHKKTTGVALVNSVDGQDDGNYKPMVGIGVDIEQTFSKRRSIAKKVLTSNELKNLGNIEGVTEDEEVLLRFSLKESVYKAMHPLISQRVSFQEAEITPQSDGTATIILNLKSGAHEKLDYLGAHWRRIGKEFFLTSARVSLRNHD